MWVQGWVSGLNLMVLKAKELKKGFRQCEVLNLRTGIMVESEALKQKHDE